MFVRAILPQYVVESPSAVKTGKGNVKPGNTPAPNAIAAGYAIRFTIDGAVTWLRNVNGAIMFGNMTMPTNGTLSGLINGWIAARGKKTRYSLDVLYNAAATVVTYDDKPLDNKPEYSTIFTRIE